MKNLICVFLLIILAGCSSTAENIKLDQDNITNIDNGYLLLGIDTNRDLKSIRLSGAASIELTHKDISADADYILIQLPAGQYTFNKIDLDRYFYLDFDEEKLWDFSVKSGKINYVGHLELFNRGFFSRSINIELLNKSSQALEFMEEQYPNILNARQITYTGAGEDSFLDFAHTPRAGE